MSSSRRKEDKPDDPHFRRGTDRRSGMDRRRGGGSPRRAITTTTAMIGTVTSYATTVIAHRWNIPLEVASAMVGLVMGWLASRYHKSMFPWSK